MPNTSNIRRNALPIIYTSGTHYEVGYDVGYTFCNMITDFLASCKYFQEKLLPAYDTEKGKAAYDLTLASLQENFPQYVRELQGTADGAKVPFHHLMLLHMDNVATMSSPQTPSDGYCGCSSVCTNHEEQVLLGHTEDALPDMQNRVYLVCATIKEEIPQGKTGCKTEEFTAFCYPGHLPGYCMGYNASGLVYSANMIKLQKVFAGKTPRQFLCRALLTADTIARAQHILRDQGTGSADGFSVNISFVRQEGDPLLYNIEVGSAEGVNESILSLHTIRPGEHLIHTNKYLRLDVPEVQTSLAIASSNRRHARAKDCPPPVTHKALLALLSDSHDAQYPFFIESSGSPNFLQTIALSVFDLVAKTWTIWIKNPSTADPLVTLPLIFKSTS